MIVCLVRCESGGIEFCVGWRFLWFLDNLLCAFCVGGAGNVEVWEVLSSGKFLIPCVAHGFRYREVWDGVLHEGGYVVVVVGGGCDVVDVKSMCWDGEG